MVCCFSFIATKRACFGYMCNPFHQYFPCWKSIKQSSPKENLEFRGNLDFPDLFPWKSWANRSWVLRLCKCFWKNRFLLTPLTRSSVTSLPIISLSLPHSGTQISSKAQICWHPNIIQSMNLLAIPNHPALIFKNAPLIFYHLLPHIQISQLYLVFLKVLTF